MKNRGYSLVELIMTMVIVGILAAVVAPRFLDSNAFQSRGFADQVKAALRYGQKVAIAQNRFVCVAFGASSITVTIDPTTPSAAHVTATCPGSALVNPDTGKSPYTVTASGNITLSGGVDFYFDPLGRPSFSSAQSITINGHTIIIEAETGYVH